MGTVGSNVIFAIGATGVNKTLGQFAAVGAAILGVAKAVKNTVNEAEKFRMAFDRLSEAALSGLPAEPPATGEWEYQLSLPPEAAGSGYDHVTVDWNPHGHIPEGVYNVPHFDFHFYVIDSTARNAITAVGVALSRTSTS